MSLRVIFMGTPDFSVPALRALNDAFDVVCVYSQPPRPAGRGQAERLTAVHATALELGLPVRFPTNLKTAPEQADFADLNADVAVVAAYGLILPNEILKAPRLGCVNIHASLLPRWRGAAPIQRAIQAGDQETGITLMQMDQGLDTGDMLAVDRVTIDAATTGESLHDTLSDMGARMIVPALKELAAGTLRAEPQPEDGVTYARKIEKAEARIDWSKDAGDIDRLIRAFSPFPGAWFDLAGERVKVMMSAMSDVEAKDASPGTVLSGNLDVACGTGAVRLVRLQRAGRAAMDSDAFLRGCPIPVGTQFRQV